uniref:Uncharacterized protein n=1 Tax=Arundo donax TaxID=35708 RepID=A0A0A9EQ43_ARUDO
MQHSLVCCSRREKHNIHTTLRLPVVGGSAKKLKNYPASESSREPLSVRFVALCCMWMFSVAIP